MAKFMIYGATGYTGRIACEYAKSLALDFLIGGRAERNTKELAASLNVAYRVFSVENTGLVDSAMEPIQVLLNCAGPFMRTAEPLIDACIRNGVHYLDIAAELDSYHLAEERRMDAEKASVMLMPGCGGSAAMLGCLVGYALKGVESAASVDVALRIAGSMSRGSAISAAENLNTNCLQRLDGELVLQDSGSTRKFDFDDGQGNVDCFPVTLPDLVTIWKATGVGNIRTYVHVSGDAFPTGDLKELPDGPTAEQRKANPYHAAVVITGRDGTVRRAALHTVNGYSFTPLASVEAARRVLAGQFRAGFQTAVGVFGAEFVETVDGSSITYF